MIAPTPHLVNLTIRVPRLIMIRADITPRINFLRAFRHAYAFSNSSLRRLTNATSSTSFTGARIFQKSNKLSQNFFLIPFLPLGTSGTTGTSRLSLLWTSFFSATSSLSSIWIASASSACGTGLTFLDENFLCFRWNGKCEMGMGKNRKSYRFFGGESIVDQCSHEQGQKQYSAVHDSPSWKETHKNDEWGSLCVLHPAINYFRPPHTSRLRKEKSLL